MNDTNAEGLPRVSFLEAEEDGEDERVDGAMPRISEVGDAGVTKTYCEAQISD